MKKIIVLGAVLSLITPFTYLYAEGLDTLSVDESISTGTTLSVEDSVSTEAVPEDVFIQNEKGAQSLILQTFGEEKGKQYIYLMNRLLAKEQSPEVLKKNKERLEAKIQKLKFSDTNYTDKEKMVYALGSYIVLKLNARLYELEKAQSTASTESISPEEKQKVQEAMDSMQFVMIQGVAKTLQEAFTSMAKGVKSNGNVQFSLKASDENIGSLDSSFTLSDYETLATSLDSSMKGKLDLVVQALMNGQTDKIDIELSTMLDMVTKNGTDTYIALKNTQAKYSDNPIVESFVKNIQKVSDIGKYVHFGNAQSGAREMQEFKDVLLFISDMSHRETFTPFTTFTPTQKIGNLYYLNEEKTENCETIKTKYTFIKTMKCSGDENAKGIMTLDMSDPQKMVYTEDIVEENGKTRLQIIFSQDTLEALSVSYIPNIDTTAQEGFLSYENGKHLNFVVRDEQGSVEVFATLGKNNALTSLDAKVEVPETIRGNMTLRNHVIQGEVDISSSSYNWETDEVTSKKVFSATIGGKTADNDTLSSLMISGSGSGLALEGDTLNVDMSYANQRTIGKIQYDNPLFFSGLLNFDYSIAGDFPRQFVINEAIDLEVSRFGKNIVEAHLKASGSSKQDDGIKILTPTDVIDVEELYESTMEESIIEP